MITREQFRQFSTSARLLLNAFNNIIRQYHNTQRSRKRLLTKMAFKTFKDPKKAEAKVKLLKTFAEEIKGIEENLNVFDKKNILPYPVEKTFEATLSPVLLDLFSIAEAMINALQKLQEENKALYDNESVKKNRYGSLGDLLEQAKAAFEDMLSKISGIFMVIEDYYKAQLRYLLISLCILEFLDLEIFADYDFQRITHAYHPILHENATLEGKFGEIESKLKKMATPTEKQNFIEEQIKKIVNTKIDILYHKENLSLARIYHPEKEDKAIKAARYLWEICIDQLKIEIPLREKLYLGGVLNRKNTHEDFSLKANARLEQEIENGNKYFYDVSDELSRDLNSVENRDWCLALLFEEVDGFIKVKIEALEKRRKFEQLNAVTKEQVCTKNEAERISIEIGWLKQLKNFIKQTTISYAGYLPMAQDKLEGQSRESKRYPQKP